MSGMIDSILLIKINKIGDEMALPTAVTEIISNLTDKAISIADLKFQTLAKKEQAIEEFKLEVRKRLQKVWDEEYGTCKDSWLNNKTNLIVTIYRIILLILICGYIFF